MKLYNSTLGKVGEYDYVTINGIVKRADTVISFEGSEYYEVQYSNDIPDDRYYTYTEQGSVIEDMYEITRYAHELPLAQVKERIRNENDLAMKEQYFSPDEIITLKDNSDISLHTYIDELPKLLDVLDILNEQKIIDELSTIEECIAYEN